MAANAAERAPEVGRFAVGVVENYSRGIEFLCKTSAALEEQPFTLCPRRYPCKRKVGDKVIVVVRKKVRYNVERLFL